MLNRRAFLSGSIALLGAAACRTSRHDIVVGSKNFTEQLILGELFAQLLEHDCHTPVDHRFYLAGTYICQQAILAGRIDVYPEYTGTALAAVLKQKASGDAAQVYQEVKEEYLQKFNLDVMPPLGFNNSFAMVMRSDDARRLTLTKLSQLTPEASRMRLGVGYEFLERADGYNGLVHAYDLKFAEAPRVMDLGLLYRAMQSHSVDIVAGSNTDGLIAALGLVVLEDDRHYFPPYDAVPIARPELFTRYPPARAVFEKLAGQISADEMRKMNYAVDGEKKDAADVAREFLQQKNLLSQ
jgi:osmoprotectant transport system substrate-binding protein